MAEIMEEEKICAEVAKADEVPIAENDDDETRKVVIAPIESDSDVE